MNNEEFFALFLDAEYKFYCLELMDSKGEEYVLDHVKEISEEFVESFKKLPDKEVSKRYDLFCETYMKMFSTPEETKKSD